MLMQRVVVTHNEPSYPRGRFTNIQKQLPAPFVVYADFESIIKPVNEDADVTQGVDTESSSHIFQEHIPCSLVYKIVSSVNPDFSRPLVNQCCLLLQNHDRLPIPPSVIYLQNHLKGQDHCNITGNYRVTAHNECNLMYRISKSGWKLPVVIHNLKGYDGHLIVKALKSEFGKVRVIPQGNSNLLILFSLLHKVQTILQRLLKMKIKVLE